MKTTQIHGCISRQTKRLCSHKDIYLAIKRQEIHRLHVTQMNTVWWVLCLVKQATRSLTSFAQGTGCDSQKQRRLCCRLGLPFVSTTARKIICQRFLWERLCSKPWSCLTVLVSHKLSLLLWVSVCSLTLSSEVYSGVLLVLLLLSSCKLHFVTGRTHKAKFPLANDCVKTQNSLISGFFLKQIPLLTLYSFDFKMELNAWLHFD